MGKCIVEACPNRSDAGCNPNKSVSFFHFPKNPKFKVLWVKNICRDEDWIPAKTSRICSVHFEEKHILVNKNGNRYLSPEAIPIFNVPKQIFFNKSTQTEYSLDERGAYFSRSHRLSCLAEEQEKLYSQPSTSESCHPNEESSRPSTTLSSYYSDFRNQVNNSSEEDHSIDNPLQTFITSSEESENINDDRTGQSISEIIPTKRIKTEECDDIKVENDPDMFLKDEYTLFGELVAIKLRQLPTDHGRVVVQHIINTALFQAQMGKFNNPPSTGSSQPELEPYNNFISDHLPEMVPSSSSVQPSALEQSAYISLSRSDTPGAAALCSLPGTYSSGSQPPARAKTEAQSSFDME